MILVLKMHQVFKFLVPASSSIDSSLVCAIKNGCLCSGGFESAAHPVAHLSVRAPNVCSFSVIFANFSFLRKSIGMVSV